MVNTALVSDEHFQFGGLATLDLLSGLVLESPRETYTKFEVAMLLEKAKTLEELFAPETVAAYELMVQGMTLPKGVLS